MRSVPAMLRVLLTLTFIGSGVATALPAAAQTAAARTAPATTAPATARPATAPASAARGIPASAAMGVPGTAQADRAGYILGADDAVTVSVYGQPDAGVQTRIKTDGTIVVPLIGNVQAAGQTVISLADVIAKKFVSGGFFKEPVVNVEIAGYVSRTINIAGKVTNPGVYPLDRSYRALEVLLKAGWVRDAGANYIYLRRADNKELRLETEALVRGAQEKNPLMEPGDTLYVPDADTFYIYGQINRAGTFPVLPGMTVRQAIALAGGVTATGSDRKVGLYRAGSKDKEEVNLDELLQKNDVVVIKERLF